MGLLSVIYVINMTIDIMEIDAAQYASISGEMWKTGNYLQVYHHGQDYLDKPPLLFWISSLSIGLLGSTSFAYKLPSVLMLLIAVWATYRFAKLWYDHRTGVIAALITGTTQAFHLMTNDVRTDGLLTSFVILSVWMLSLYLKKGKILYLLIGGVCIGGGMLAKGPLGLMIPATAIGGHLLITGQWKKIFNPYWLLLLLSVAIVITPMCYGLYQQFDLHPEKEVYGLTGPSGLGFYFWIQSFGRLTGDLAWDNHTPWYFFLLTILWDLQPWVLLFIPALLKKIKRIFDSRTDDTSPVEWISLFGFIIPLIALSFSRYKLPHYIFPLFPFIAIVISDYIIQYAKQLPRWFEYLQLGLLHLLWIAAALVMFGIFPVRTLWLPALWIIGYAGIWWWRAKAADAVDRWILPSLMGILIFQFTLSSHFYPNLLSFQSSSQAGKFLAQHPEVPVYWHDKFGYALDYYSGREIPNAFGPPVDTLSAGSWILVSAEALPTMPPHDTIRVFDDYPVTKLTSSFLFPGKRMEKIKKMYLVELKG